VSWSIVHANLHGIPCFERTVAQNDAKQNTTRGVFSGYVDFAADRHEWRSKGWTLPDRSGVAMMILFASLPSLR
jgi:hypothetical protein